VVVASILYLAHAVGAVVAPLVGVAITGAVWWTRSDRASRAFAVFTAAATLWSVTVAIAFFVPTQSVASLTLRLGNVFAWVLAVGWLVFCLYYTGYERWLTRRTWALIAVTFVGGVSTVLINPGGLVWTDLTMRAEPFRHLVATRGPQFWVNTVVGYLYMSAGLFLLFRTALSARGLSRRQPLVIAVATVPNLVAHSAQNTAFVPVPGFDYVAVTFILFTGVVTYMLFREDFLRAVPVTRTAVIESVPDGILVVDDQRRVVDYNDAATDLFPGLADGEKGLTPIPSALEDGNGYVDRFDRPTETGPRQFVVESSESRGLTVLVVRETTDIERRTRQLERQTEQLEQFASTVSHDLRNPLSVAKGRIELEMGPGDDESLAIALSALDRAEDIIEDALKLAQQGRAIEDRERVGLAAVARDAWETTETGRASLTVETDSGVTVYADRARVRAAFENLFRNALDHGPAGVAVSVGHTDEGFFVADDGPGVPDDAREAAFQQGYTTADDGTGFGLAIVESVAEAHGWTVSITTSDDGGARFEFEGVETLSVPADDENVNDGWARSTSDG